MLPVIPVRLGKYAHLKSSEIKRVSISLLSQFNIKATLRNMLVL